MIEPPPARRICGGRRLAGEEHMPQIDGLAFVPARFGHLFQRLPVVARGIVDEDAERTDPACSLVDGGLDRRNVAQIGLNENRGMLGMRSEPFNQRPALGFGNIDESNACALESKAFDEGSANPRSAAGNEDATPFEVVKLRGWQGHDGVVSRMQAIGADLLFFFCCSIIRN